MSPRLNPYEAAPGIMEPLVALENALRESGLELGLFHLVKTRASQLNGCAYCIHMHTRDARRHGETEERLYLLDAWRDSSLYTPRELAALAWTEAVTRVAESRVPDAVYAELRREFSEAEIVKLTVLVGTINTWNRIAVSFRTPHPTTSQRHA